METLDEFVANVVAGVPSLWMPDSGRDRPLFVWGRDSVDRFVALPVHEAVEMAQLQLALKQATTWGELWRRTTPARRRQLDRILEEGVRSGQVQRLPGHRDPFDRALLHSIRWEWPAPPHKRMREVLPGQFQQRYGKPRSFGFDCDIVEIEFNEEVCREFLGLGYGCIRDDVLIGLACGDVPD